jgi:hypothetical protein
MLFNKLCCSWQLGELIPLLLLLLLLQVTFLEGASGLLAAQALLAHMQGEHSTKDTKIRVGKCLQDDMQHSYVSCQWFLQLVFYVLQPVYSTPQYPVGCQAA